MKKFPISTQLSMKFFLLIHVKMPTTVGILTFMSMKNNILGLSKKLNFYVSAEIISVCNVTEKSEGAWHTYTVCHAPLSMTL